ncbi:hypothetical protein C8J57DRAFT_1718386 [Mycena rebaudengoi]|nr:hypothetical protein C8J57DRAFT_1718386 [Mycena rebaudengoi]
MSGSGVTFYDEQLKYLLRLLKALPHTIPIGETHNFIGYVPDPQEVIDTGCTKAVVSHTLEISFVALEEVTTVLRDHIIGNGGMNLLLTLWVDDLIEGATAAITTAGGRLPRPIQITAAKRLLEDETVKERAQKKQKTDHKVAKDVKKKSVATAKKQAEQGAMQWPIADLQDDKPLPASTATTTKRGPTPDDLLDRLVIACHSINRVVHSSPFSLLFRSFFFPFSSLFTISLSLL